MNKNQESEDMTNSEPVRCQKCGKPVGFITILSKGLTGFQQPLENAKIVAICMDCYKKA
jgi:hypothetical protein